MEAYGLADFSKREKERLEVDLKERINLLSGPKVLKDAMYYSLEAGGKRIRPLLVFATLEAFGIDTKHGLPMASAIEMIHTYSLIHDDLPSMDNDDLRRGKPTNHKVFGEANAILAGDALLTYSFEVIANAKDEQLDASKKVKLIAKLAQSSGAEGMVGGQVADIAGEDKQLTLEEIEYIHVHKTGKLLACSVEAGAIIADASIEQLEKFSQFAYHLGLAFQIQDDILDLEGTEEMIGKPVGSDENKNKSTYPALLTMDGAKKALANHLSAAKELLKETKLNTKILEEITDLIGNRNH
ncbi:polyprenyl synthetase family protein [Cytobacillus spongiae]|uniref:polyprenyl synthetase family protein n=1 Tax=Cytobacillus spongiae TaxID=2901381 RepID=UPI00254641BF|nr:farnesyl diphosphate synthase [Cytobacillus spongiae]